MSRLCRKVINFNSLDILHDITVFKPINIHVYFKFISTEAHDQNLVLKL